ncbi:MAG: hypothetical protein EXR75_09595 [Myxococcales bacterium]|nr:hypothetical protein [Myxococcales bacterium]
MKTSSVALALTLLASAAHAHGKEAHAPQAPPPREAGEPPTGIEIRTADEDATDPGVVLPSSPLAEASPATPTEAEQASRAANAKPSEPPTRPARTETFREEAVTEEELEQARHGLPDEDWRQSHGRNDDRKDAVVDLEHYLFELRFGGYFPEIDEEFDGKATPYADFFGDSGQTYFGVELDWLPLRIPYVGRVGAAWGWGVTKASGSTRLESDPSTEAGSETTLSIMPMHASAVIRFDALLHYGIVPIVPYVKAGFGFAQWQASGASGTSEAVDDAGNNVKGQGLTTGRHFAIGGALALNAFDEAAARSLFQASGIRYAFLWGEWMRADLDGFGDATQMRVGTSTGVGGLGLEW